MNAALQTGYMYPAAYLAVGEANACGVKQVMVRCSEDYPQKSRHPPGVQKALLKYKSGGTALHAIRSKQTRVCESSILLVRRAPLTNSSSSAAGSRSRRLVFTARGAGSGANLSVSPGSDSGEFVSMVSGSCLSEELVKHFIGRYVIGPADVKAHHQSSAAKQ